MASLKKVAKKNVFHSNLSVQPPLGKKKWRSLLALDRMHPWNGSPHRQHAWFMVFLRDCWEERQRFHKQGWGAQRQLQTSPKPISLITPCRAFLGEKGKFAPLSKRKWCYREITRTRIGLRFSKICQLFYLMGSSRRRRELREPTPLYDPRFTDQTKEAWKSALCYASPRKAGGNRGRTWTFELSI